MIHDLTYLTCCASSVFIWRTDVLVFRNPNLWSRVMGIFQCEACGRQLVDGDVQYSAVYEEEHLDDGAYTVTKSVGLMSLCPSCYVRHNIASKVDVELSRELSNKLDNLPDMFLVDPDDSMYNCCRCGSMIRDGNTICSVNHALEVIEADSLLPVETNMSHVMCETCANSVEYKSMAQGIIEHITADIRR